MSALHDLSEQLNGHGQLCCLDLTWTMKIIEGGLIKEL